MDLALFLAHHHIPVLTGFFRAPCPCQQEELSLLPKTQGIMSSSFQVPHPYFKRETVRKHWWRSCLNVCCRPWCILLAFGVKDVCLKEKGGVKGKMWKAHQHQVFRAVRQFWKCFVHLEGAGVKK